MFTERLRDLMRLRWLERVVARLDPWLSAEAAREATLRLDARVARRFAAADPAVQAEAARVLALAGDASLAPRTSAVLQAYRGDDPVWRLRRGDLVGSIGPVGRIDRRGDRTAAVDYARSLGLDEPFTGAVEAALPAVPKRGDACIPALQLVELGAALELPQRGAFLRWTEWALRFVELRTRAGADLTRDAALLRAACVVVCVLWIASGDLRYRNALLRIGDVLLRRGGSLLDDAVCLTVLVVRESRS